MQHTSFWKLGKIYVNFACKAFHTKCKAIIIKFHFVFDTISTQLLDANRAWNGYNDNHIYAISQTRTFSCSLPYGISLRFTSSVTHTRCLSVFIHSMATSHSPHYVRLMCAMLEFIKRNMHFMLLHHFIRIYRHDDDDGTYYFNNCCTK